MTCPPRSALLGRDVLLPHLPNERVVLAEAIWFRPGAMVAAMMALVSACVISV
jgi:hypothetical protein